MNAGEASSGDVVRHAAWDGSVCAHLAPISPADWRATWLPNLRERHEAGGAFLSVPHSVQRLIAVVALRRYAARQTVATHLWPDYSEPRAQGNLRSAIWRAHRLAEDLLGEEAGRLCLGPAVEVDLNQLNFRSNQTPYTASAVLTDELWSTELLPGWYEDWVLAERERLRQLR